MEHADLYLLRETYNEKCISLCFNGPFSQGMIEEIGSALRSYLNTEDASTSSSLDVFGVYIEIAQNIRQYSSLRGYRETDACATVVIGRNNDGNHVISAGNVIEIDDGKILADRINFLAQLDKAQLKAVYKEQLRQPRDENNPDSNAGLGLIDIARKASQPFTCELRPIQSGSRMFFSLRVVI